MCIYAFTIETIVIRFVLSFIISVYELYIKWTKSIKILKTKLKLFFLEKGFWSYQVAHKAINTKWDKIQFCEQKKLSVDDPIVLGWRPNKLFPQDIWDLNMGAESVTIAIKILANTTKVSE